MIKRIKIYLLISEMVLEVTKMPAQVSQLDTEYNSVINSVMKRSSGSSISSRLIHVENGFIVTGFLSQLQSKFIIDELHNTYSKFHVFIV